MPISNSTYPFDPTGTLASNKITGEQHIITPVNYKDYSFIVPTLAPFFATSLVMTFRDADDNVVNLVEGVDWYLSHWFISASRACSKPIYGSISLLNKTLSGVITIEYQTLGGDWNIDEDLIAQILADRLHNPRTTSWDSVSEMPYAFPVIDHEWDLVDMVGMSEVVEALDEIRGAILFTGGSEITEHIANHNNPHQTNKTHVGLSNVQNYPVATKPQAEAGTDHASYMTPLRTREAILFNNSGIQTTLDDHINDTDNPHETTANGVGTYSYLELDMLFMNKLDASATAVDSLKFGGQTPMEYMAEVLTGTAANAVRFDGHTYAEAKADILTGTSANSLKFNNLDMDGMVSLIDSRISTGVRDAIQTQRLPYESVEADSWTPIIEFTIGNISGSLVEEKTLQAMVSGGQSASASKDAVYIVSFHIATSGAVDIKPISITGYTSNIDFGITTSIDGLGLTQAVIWLRSTGVRAAINTMALTSSDLLLVKETGTQDDIVTVEPTSIDYADDVTLPFVTAGQLDDLVNALTLAFNSLE